MSSEKYPKLHLVDVMSDTWYPIPPPPPPPPPPPCNVEESGIIIPGSTANSDLSASVAFIKNKLRAKLQAHQKTGRVTEW